MIENYEKVIESDERLSVAAKARKYGIQAGGERERKILDNLEALKKEKKREQDQIKSLEEKMKSFKVNGKQDPKSLLNESKRLIDENEKLSNKLNKLMSQLEQERRTVSKKIKEARKSLEKTKKEVADIIAKAERDLADCLAKAKQGMGRPRTVLRATPGAQIKGRRIADANIAATAFKSAVERAVEALKKVKIYTEKLKKCEDKTGGKKPGEVALPGGGGEEVSVDIVQVIPRIGNNPLNPENPVGTGEETGISEKPTGGGGTEEKYIKNDTYIGNKGCNLGSVTVKSNSEKEFEADIPNNGDVTFTGDGSNCPYCKYSASGLTFFGKSGHTAIIELTPPDHFSLSAFSSSGSCEEVFGP